MKKLLIIVTLAALMISPALAQTSADDREQFSIGPSETPSDGVIVEGRVKSPEPEPDPNVGSDSDATPNAGEGGVE
jgi:heat shock protein HslJ